MTIKKALRLYPGIETELLLAHVLGKTKEFLYINASTELARNEQESFRKLARRRLGGEPIAYIMGYKEFYGRKFLVNRHVLVPRPSSEWLVETAIQKIKNYNIETNTSTKKRQKTNLPLKQTAVKIKGMIKVLDLGTGSGCIAISVAKELPPGIQIVATDISTQALVTAKKNARIHKAKVTFIKSDLYTNVQGQFDIVIANLPYVPATVYKELYDSLKYEPKLAVTEGTNVFKIYKEFLKQSVSHIKPGGVILLEMDPQTKPFMTKWTKIYFPKSKLKFYKDLQKLCRYAEIQT